MGYDDYKTRAPEDDAWQPDLRPNATCAQCGEDFQRGRDDIGPLCDRCCDERDAKAIDQS